MNIINVITDKNNNKNYNIYIDDNLLDSIENLIDFPNKTLIITDSNIPSEYYEKIVIKAKYSYVYKITPGENSKTFDSYLKIMNLLIDNTFSRKDLVIALGGGVVGDLAGFVASTYKRGVDFINIPTSTLSMIDSSIGGKVAINVNDIKNIVGSFYMPKKVIISLDTLNSLPRRQYYNGLIEALKAGLIYDESLYQMFINGFEKLEEREYLREIILKSVNIKKDVVEKDPYEKGLRKILNFGHTIGHVIESENFDKIYHGEAVLIGMMYFCSEEILKELKCFYNKLNIINNNVFNNIKLDIDNGIKLLANDKKASGEYVDVVYVEKVGSHVVRKVLLSNLEEKLKEKVYE